MIGYKNVGDEMLQFNYTGKAMLAAQAAGPALEQPAIDTT